MQDRGYEDWLRSERFERAVERLKRFRQLEREAFVAWMEEAFGE